MVNRFLGAATIGLLLAVPARAQDYDHLRLAQEHLQAAWDNLRAAPPDTGGHRDRAVGYVNKALQQLHLALAGQAPRSHLEEKKQRREEDIERRKQLRDQHLEEKEEEREERMEQR